MSTAEDTWRTLLPPVLASAGIDVSDNFEVVPLTGGVSSDIVRIRTADGRDFCAKRALSQLRVAAEWKAPLERTRYEIAWLRQADAIVPGAVPAVIGFDAGHGIALIEYLPPEQFFLWKEALLRGHCDVRIVRAVADVIGKIHFATWMDDSVRSKFDNDALFDALRLDPYLRTLAGRYPALAKPILDVLTATVQNTLALVHGDLSPKNILIRIADNQPVLLDAECAWFGDPAFDAAFCITHLLLKATHIPAIRTELKGAAATFAATWLSHFPATERPPLEARTAALLPCLMLARVDGKSPVEYLSALQRQIVRDIAIPLLLRPRQSIAEVAAEV